MKQVSRHAGGFHDTAVYSDDMRYRYEFHRTWASGQKLVWVLLNPATGDTDGKPRPTLGRCIQRSQDWGFGGLTIVNLFAFRATKPRELLLAEDPIGPDNEATLRAITRAASQVVAAWGAHGRLLGRGREVAARLPRGTLCFGLTRLGEPRHPLYVSAGTEATPLDPWKDDDPTFELVQPR